MAEFPEQTQKADAAAEASRGGRTRTRTHAWEDPAPMLAAFGERSGLDLLLAMGSGEVPLPPFASTVGLEAVSAEPGRVVFSLVPGEHHLNPLGSMHGGVIATLLDTCAGCAVHSTLPAGSAYTTIDLSVKYLRPVTPASGLIRGEGVVVSAGRRTALAEARAYDSEGRLIAHATSTCLIIADGSR